jgi:trehalose 6-phosphate synthase/phosphatase
MIGNNMEPRVVIVSNRLPVRITQSEGKLTLHRSSGGLATGLNAIANTHPMLWIGWMGNTQKLSDQQFADLNMPDGLLPIRAPIRAFQRYYDRVSNGVLWPTLHGMKPNVRDTLRDWESVNKIIGTFADAVVSQCKPSDLLWIHDFHLVLLMQALRERGVKNRIGFFLHTPFPSPDIFMKLPQHKQLLASLNATDLLGVQTAKDMLHITSCLQKEGPLLSGRASVQVFPIGIDADAYHRTEQSTQIQAYLARLRPHTLGKKVILSVSRLDYTKGITTQLRAFAQAVKKYHIQDIMYRLIVAPSREARIEYRQLKQRIERTVDTVNAQFASIGASAHVSFEYRDHNFEELSAWYQLSDVLLITPLVDGMNLVVKEYIAARTQPGTIVLSKTAGAAYQLREAILVPPTNIRSIAEGLLSALTMDGEAKQRCWAALRANVDQFNIFWWSDTFLTTLATLADLT